MSKAPFPFTLVSGGANPKTALNLVVLSDGYTAGELGRYATTVSAFVAALHAEPALNSFSDRINVFRVDVPSEQSGCSRPGGERKTHFRSRSVGDRVITTDQTIAIKEAGAALKGLKLRAIVQVNTPEYGGSGGGVAVFSSEVNAPQIAIHEIGHSEFGLGDEYEDPAAPQTEKSTANRNIALGPIVTEPLWLNRLTPPGARIFPNPGPGGVLGNDANGVVGLFEGALFHSSGRYRPTATCKMRDLRAPFCAVCEDLIAEHLSMHYAP
ncbi:MAG TPA: M64 family metallopeptidase [Longimicrobiaceae bacterium]|jgi:hypothetical protein|nr:M64 family metallopeptidase [Longimicrobiaceae bacterium]